MSEAKTFSFAGGSVMLSLFSLFCLIRCKFCLKSFIYSNYFCLALRPNIALFLLRR